ncbi:hypothetical protein RB195_008978 [Necator americanus]|uniref:Uncharacterized protein n=1 Tax=Necator americanus TaxID=51031 RepID=A0ABR1CR70_NECAM
MKMSEAVGWLRPNLIARLQVLTSGSSVTASRTVEPSINWERLDRACLLLRNGQTSEERSMVVVPYPNALLKLRTAVVAPHEIYMVHKVKEESAIHAFCGVMVRPHDTSYE